MRSREAAALAAATFLVGITVIWWALALWPATASATWLARTREVCFGAAPGGLPDAAGWVALVLQPTIMFGVLFALWGEALEGGVRALSGWLGGRIALGALGLLLGAGFTAATLRVLNASAAEGAFSDPPLASEAGASLPPRLDRAAPSLRLVDQHGHDVSLEHFRGRPVFVTFAFGHCETVCPVVVRDVLRACDQVPDLDPVALIVTLDPWRDVPTRLPALAEQWELGTRGHVLSGTIDQVEGVLDHWNVTRARNETTGDVVHSRVVYVIDRNGTIAFVTSGTTADLVALARQL